MTEEIKIEVKAKDQSAEQMWDRQNRALDQIVDKLNKVEKAGDKAGKTTEGSFAGAVGQLGQFATAVTGVGSVIGGVLAVANQLRREYDNMVQRQKTAADSQIGFEQQLAQTIRNAGGVLSGKEVKEMSLRLAEDASVDPSKAAAVLGSAFSARGVSNKQQAEQVREASEAVLKFAPELSAEDSAMFAGTAIDVMKRTGATAKQAVGLTQVTSGLSRTTTLKGVAENVLPGAMQMQELGGGTLEENAALSAALTQGIIDPEGSVSRTAGIALVKALRERMPELENTQERLKKLQADPKLQKAFLEGGKFGKKKFGEADIGRGQAQSSVESLIRGSGTAFNAFDEFRETIGDQQLAGETFDKMTREVGSQTITSRLQRTLKSAATQQSILDERGGQVSVSREGLKEFLQASGQSALGQSVESAIFEGQALNDAPVDVASRRLRSNAKRLREDRTPSVSGPAYAPTLPATPEAMRSASAMEKLANRLEELSDELKRNTAATADNSRGMDDPGAPPRPVRSAALSQSP